MNQSKVIDRVSKLTNYPKHEILDILRAVSNLTTETLSTTTGTTEIKLFPGMVICGTFKSRHDMAATYHNITDKAPSDKILIHARITKDYKDKINHKAGRRTT